MKVKRRGGQISELPTFLFWEGFLKIEMQMVADMRMVGVSYRGPPIRGKHADVIYERLQRRQKRRALRR